MRNILLLTPLLLSLACKEPKTIKVNAPLTLWILNNQKLIDLTSDTIVSGYKKRNAIDSNWISSTVAISKYYPNILGKLAAKAGDSTDCIVVLLSFYKDPNRKKNIFIAATDSLCLNKLGDIILPADSTDHFTFAVQKELLE